jgi:hypothetical protein
MKNNNIDEFIHMLDANLVNVRQRYIKEHTASYGYNDHRLESTAPRREYIHVLEIPSLNIEQFMNELSSMIEKDDHQREELEKTKRNQQAFVKFMEQNSQLRQQYEELMTMCKLAGLKNTKFL